MGPTKAVVTIVEAALIFRAVSWIVKSQHALDRTQQMVRWVCVIVSGLLILLNGFTRWSDSTFGLLVLIGSSFLFVLFLMLPDCAYYIVYAVRRFSENE